MVVAMNQNPLRGIARNSLAKIDLLLLFMVYAKGHTQPLEKIFSLPVERVAQKS